MPSTAESRVPRGQPDVRAAAVVRAVERRTSDRRRIAAHCRPAIDAIERALAGGRCVLDLGCGTAESTRSAARADPARTYIGVDRSAARLARAQALRVPENARLLRADIDDVLAVARRRGWRFDAIWLLFPNPSPKPSQLGRRFYARGALRDVVAVTERFETRTNWPVYADELVVALAALGVRDVRRRRYTSPLAPTTAFERKYAASGHALVRVHARWGSAAAAGPTTRGR